MLNLSKSAGLPPEPPSSRKATANDAAGPGPRAKSSPKIENPNNPNAKRGAQESADQMVRVPTWLGGTAAGEKAPMDPTSNLLSVRADPEKMLRGKTDKEASKSKVAEQLEDIEICYESGAVAEDNAWRDLPRVLGKGDREEAKKLCRLINPAQWVEIFVAFCDQLLKTEYARTQTLRARDSKLDPKWYARPWYGIDPRYFYTAEGTSYSTFGQVARGLQYVRYAGFENVLLLPHSDSDWHAGGHGVTDYKPARLLGGEHQFEILLEQSRRLGVRMAASSSFNHTSIHHEWFQRGMAGDKAMEERYLGADNMERAGESSIGGAVMVHYRDTDRKKTVRRFFESDFRPHDHTLEVDIGHSHRKFYSSLKPYQVDLDLRNPSVLQALFEILGRDANQGLLGVCDDTVGHWIKNPGTSGFGLPETHSLLALFKLFLKLVSPRQIVLPGVEADTVSAAKYCGRNTEIHRVGTSSEGDVFLWTRASVALRESIYLETKAPIESAVRDLPELPRRSRPLAFIEHQGEIPLELASSSAHADALRDHLASHRGRVSKGGLAGGCRNADCLEHDPQRIALSLFSLYMLPATPLVYFGTEIGTGNNQSHAELIQRWRYEYLKELGHSVPEEACFDPAELHQGSVPRGNFKHAASARYFPLKTLRALNRLWEKRPSLRSLSVQILETSSDGVLAWLKSDPDDEDRPLLLVANLTGKDRVVKVSLKDFPSQMADGTKVTDALYPKRKLEQYIDFNLTKDDLAISLGSYGFRAVDLVSVIEEKTG